MRESHAMAAAWARVAQVMERAPVVPSANSLDFHRWHSGVVYHLDASWPREQWSEACRRIERGP